MKLMRAVAFRGAVTGAAATAAWAMASIIGRPQRAATVALISLVTTELGQSLVDSHAPLVLLTSAGSFGAFVLMIGTPGISRLLGCTPVGPVGWAQGVGSAGAAVLALAAANRLLPAAWRGAGSPGTDTAPALDQRSQGLVVERPTADTTAPSRLMTRIGSGTAGLSHPVRQPAHG